MELTQVASSDLSAVGFYGSTLVIEFHDGSMYEYYGVPPSDYFGLMNAASHGKYFHQNIKNRYPFRRIG
jgi:hypothetical protein